MANIKLDFETRSEVGLVRHDSIRYLKGNKADIICLGYKIENEPTQLWIPGYPIPEFAKHIEGHTFYAFNAQFDRNVWNILGRKYNFTPTPFSSWVDVMALCGRFTYHQSLAQAGEDLNLKVQKNPYGKILMKKICTSPFEFTHAELFEFYDYCKNDVNTMCEMINALPSSKLSQDEQKIWELTAKINSRGIPIDVKAVNQILKVTEVYKEEQNRLLPQITNGAITKATQAIRITKWLRNEGIVTPNLQAATVEKLLERQDLTEDVETVLILRQELGKSSTAKYAKLQDIEYHGRIYNNLRYYAANTGRWGGLGFQIHNLPRSKVKDADPIIESFYNLSIIENNPINAAKSVIRGMICAPKGKAICAADYSSIENRILVWTAEDEKTLELFRQGLNQYKDMATFLYQIPYGEEDEDQYYVSKQLVLGCGYGLGWRGFQKYMEAAGKPISDVFAQTGVNAWRARYKKVVKMWYACRGAAINAISYPGHEYKVGMCSFKLVRDRNKITWLQLKLPSGRNLYYNKPEIGEGDYGPEVTAMGINPYSKKWMRLKIIPGRFVENIVQATARDILAHGKLELDKALYKIIGSIHDEVIIEVMEDEDCLKEVCELICKNPVWAKGLPLKAEGIIEKRYRKM